MPPATWRERVGDVPRAGDSASRRRGRPVFSLAGPRQTYFSIPPHIPDSARSSSVSSRQQHADQPTASTARSSRSASADAAAAALHPFPFRATSRHPEPFRPSGEASAVASRPSSRANSRSGSIESRASQGAGSASIARSGVGVLDLDLAQRASLKGPGTPREVASLVHQLESAMAARYDPDCDWQRADSAQAMRRVAREGLRAALYDRGRRSTAPAREPLVAHARR